MALVLTRTPGESITLKRKGQPDVLIGVLPTECGGVRGDAVRLFIEAPEEVAIWRTELLEKESGNARRQIDRFND